MDWREQNEVIELRRRLETLADVAEKYMVVSDPLPPDGVDVAVALGREVERARLACD